MRATKRAPTFSDKLTIQHDPNQNSGCGGDLDTAARGPDVRDYQSVTINNWEAIEISSDQRLQSWGVKQCIIVGNGLISISLVKKNLWPVLSVWLVYQVVDCCLYNCGSLSVTNTARHLTSATQHAGGGHHFVTLWASQFQRWFYEKLGSTDDWDLSNVGSRGAAMETNLVYYSALCTSLCGEQSISLSSQHPQFTAVH